MSQKCIKLTHLKYEMLSVKINEPGLVCKKKFKY